VARAQRSGARIKNSSPSPEKLKPNAAALESRASNCPILSHSAPKKHGTNSRRFFRFLNHLGTLESLITPVTGSPAGKRSTLMSWRIGWLNTRFWRLRSLWHSRSRSSLFLRLWNGITSSSSPSEARTISRKKRSPATVELPDNKTARHFLTGCS
jgi:hypothetical protein